MENDEHNTDKEKMKIKVLWKVTQCQSQSTRMEDKGQGLRPCVVSM